jgi:hypothetical protein
MSAMKTGIERKLQDIQLLAADPNPEVFDALSSLGSASSTGGQNWVRAALEEKELATYVAFIDSFSTLRDSFRRVFDSVASLDASCDAMLAKLSLGREGLDRVLDMTTSLHAQQAKQKRQLGRIQSFIDEFYLPRAELDLLSSGDITDAFFDVFGRLEAAQSRVSAQRRIAQSQCLSECFASLNTAKEHAYQRMYHWLHMSSHLFDSSDPAVGAVYRRCLATIKAKPFLYGFVVEEVAKVRGDVVGRVFMRALSAGDGDTRPLESSSAVDPLQFVGDIFAWVHQATAGEATFFSNLVHEDAASKVVKNSMAIVFGSIIRPLEVRVSHAIKGLGRPADLYQMVNLCSFFTATFGGICGFTSPLSKCCDALRLNATA